MPASAISLSQEFIDASNIVYNDGALSAGGITPLFVAGQPVVLSVASDSFFARAYTDSSGNIIIAYRGTTDLSTVLGADAALARGEFIPALHDAIDFADRVRGLVGNTPPIYVTGHSLGGAEAEAVVSNRSWIAGGMTFGAPGLPTAAHGSVTPTDFIDYVEYLDPVGNAASDAFNPLYTNLLHMGTHVGAVNYVGDLQSHILSALPGIDLLTSVGSLGINELTKWAQLTQSADAFHGLDVYAGNLSLALNGSSPVTQQQSSAINAAVTKVIAQQVIANSTAATPTTPSYPVITVADHIPALPNATIPIGAFFSGHETPASSGHHIDHYSVFIVYGSGSLQIGNQSYTAGHVATNVSPAQLSLATFHTSATGSNAEVAVVAFDDLGVSSLPVSTTIFVQGASPSPQPSVTSDHTPPAVIATGQAFSLVVGGAADLSSNYLQVSDLNSAHYTPDQLTYTVTSAPSHGYLLKAGSIVSSFTQADVNNHLVKFQEDGTIASSDSFTYFVSDPAGNRSPSATFSVGIAPQPISTHPTQTTNIALSVGQAQSALITDENLFVTDAGLNPWQIIYTVVSGPAHGQVIADRIIPVTYFTQQQVDLGLISYKNTGNTSGPDNFIFSVADTFGGSIGQATFGVNVIPSNNLHVLQDRPLYNDPGANTIPPSGNYTPWDVSVLDTEVLNATDPGVPASNVVYTITGMPANTFFLVGQFGPGSAFTGYSSFSGYSFGQSDITNGFTHSFTQTDLNSGHVYLRNIAGGGGFSYGSELDISFSVSDNVGNSISNLTLPLVIEPGGILSAGALNTFGSIPQTYLTAAISQNTSLGRGLLAYVAPQSTSTQEVYHVFFLPTHGSLLLDGHSLAVGADITQQDIDQGRVSYLQDGSLTASDQFGFVAHDPFHPGGIAVYVNVKTTGTSGGVVESGAAASELLAAGFGNNTFIGDGNSTVSYADSPNGVSVDLSQSKATNGYGGTDTISNVHSIVGSSFADTLFGSTGSDRVFGGLGNDNLDGRGGIDTAFFSGNPDNFQWLQNLDGSFTVRDLRSNAPQGIDTLRNIEGLEFDSGPDVSGNTSTTTVDIGNAFPWSTDTRTYDAQGKLSTVVDKWDSGLTFLTDYNLVHTNPWNSATSTYDAQGRLGFVSIYKDVTLVTTYDAAGNQPWSQAITGYDAQGRLDYVTVVNDNRGQLYTRYNYSGNTDYTTYSYDAQNHLTQTYIHHVDGTFQIVV